MDQTTELGRALDKMHLPRVAERAGAAEQNAEDLVIGIATGGVYGFRLRHPFVYGLIAFIIGGGATAVAIASTYRNWTFEGVDLTTAVYQIVFGSLAGAIVLTLLAFAYAATMRPAQTRR